jgi:hypothetical protein
MIVYFIPRSFHLLQPRKASVQSVDPLPENRLQSVNADFVQNFSDSRKKLICKPELLSSGAVFEMPKQKTKKQETRKKKEETRNKKQEMRNKKKSEGTKSS